MAIQFKEAVKHGSHQFFPGVPVAFADERAEEYFLATGWAVPSDDAPVHTYPVGSIVIDLETVFADNGRKVLKA